MKRIQLFAPSFTALHPLQVGPNAAQGILQLAHLCQQGRVRSTIHFAATEKAMVRCDYKTLKEHFTLQFNKAKCIEIIPL